MIPVLGSFRHLTQAVVDPDRAREFGRVTQSAAVTDLAPPMFGVCLARPAFVQGLADSVPAELAATTPILHGEHVYRSTRPLELGRTVDVGLALLGVGSRPSGAVVLIGVRLEDGAGLIEEHELTAFLPGADLGPAVGEPVRPLSGMVPGSGDVDAERRLLIDTSGDLSRRYGAVADDRTPFHMDDDQARSFGFPRVILHGLCTLTLAVNALLREGPAGSAVQGVAARFAAPGHPGEQLTVARRHLSEGNVGFTVSRPSGQIVLKHGLLSTSAPTRA